MTSTEVIYDLCCGESPTVTERGDVTRVSCQACGAATRWVHRLDALAEWSKTKRKMAK